MGENFDVFDFVLDEKDMQEIMKLDNFSHLFFDHADPIIYKMVLYNFIF